MIALGYEDLDLDPTLERIAVRAGVSVQTVLRHFGTRDALLAAAIETGQVEVEAERVTPDRDAVGALAALVAHYERRGPFALEMLARERTDARAAAVTTGGKHLHRRWVETVFADRLPGGDQRDALVDLLVVATDVYAWKLLHLDRALPAETVVARMRTMTDAILASHRS
ncbi:MAG TPA: TetR family transcriptional regulator [Amnibacterium sp.]|uniref:TetR/AcrR family transcriptional regulator n=1 Tax=Amnibacterium sp. TaxID=1872496 RepID=UPI002F95BCBC